MSIYAFTGTAESGKTTSSNMLRFILHWHDNISKEKKPTIDDYINLDIYEFVQSNYGSHNPYKILSFATPIKELVSKYTGINILELNHPCNKKVQIGNHTIREIMIIFGDMLKGFDSNILIQIMDFHMDDNSIIDDCRTIHEAKYIVSVGGKIIRIEKNEPNSDHETETDCLSKSFNCDYIIRNIGGYDELFNKLINIVYE